MGHSWSRGPLPMPPSAPAGRQHGGESARFSPMSVEEKEVVVVVVILPLWRRWTLEGPIDASESPEKIPRRDARIQAQK